MPQDHRQLTIFSYSLAPLDRLQFAAAPAALHNSDDRFDPPRCHPNTRIAVMDELIDWVIRRGDAGHTRMLWLSGPAGAGKSAIAQSLSELCLPQKFLLATFFFNRSDSSRNNPKRLVATITSQIYGMVPQRYKYLILEVIEDDPLIFDRSIETQFKALIMDPLRDLFEIDYFNNYDAPRLIVLDGLDECSTPAAQVNILTAVQTMLKQSNTPFIFLVASRPEHDIQTFFKLSCLGSLIYRLDLDDSYLPDGDIYLFVKDKLKEIRAIHPSKDSIPREWPSEEVIQTIVQKSSGQFVYASVVVKYVTSNRHFPPNRLDVVLQLRAPKRDLPFAELDALYSHIFSCVEDKLLVLRILCIVLVQDSYWAFSIENIEQLCALDQGECLSALCDLQSILQVKSIPQQSIHLLHKSLPDYLQDPARSHDYYIDTTPRAVIPTVTQCLRLISGVYATKLYTF